MSSQAMADYLSEALATDDNDFIHDALDTIERAKSRQGQPTTEQSLQMTKRTS
jgi:DNA-binding phage protein